MRCCGYGARPLVVGALGDGMGRWRVLAAGVLRCLTARGLTSGVFASGACIRTRCLTATFLASSPASNVDEEGSDLVRDTDWVEEEGARGVFAARGGIGWVLRARDVSCIYRSAAILRELDDASENMICRFVGAAFLPPTLDDSAVVPVDHDVVSFLRALAYADNEKFETDCFRPLDVSPVGLPIGSKSVTIGLLVRYDWIREGL